MPSSGFFLFFFLNIYCTPLNSVIHVRSLLQLVHMVRACSSGDAIKGCGFKFILIWRQKKKKVGKCDCNWHWMQLTSKIKCTKIPLILFLHIEIIYGRVWTKIHVIHVNKWTQLEQIHCDIWKLWRHCIYLLHSAVRNLISVCANTQKRIIEYAAEIFIMFWMKPMRTNKYGNRTINLVWHRPMSNELINLFRLLKLMCNVMSLWHLDSNSLI